MYPVSGEGIPSVIFIVATVVVAGLIGATITNVSDVGMTLGDQVTSPADTSAPESGQKPDIGTNDGGGNQTTGGYVDLRYCIEELRTAEAIVGFLAVILGLLYLSYRRFGFSFTLLGGLVALPWPMATYFFLTNCPSSVRGGGLSDFNPAGGADGAVASPNLPTELFALVVGVLTLGGLGLLYVMARQEDEIVPVEQEQDDEPTTDSFAEAAGRAADRIESANVPVDNAVYQAWWEMTNLLNIENPKTVAPYEFAEEAIELGLDRDDVTELTQLFTEVRYGGKDPDTREEDALQVLRTIEEKYRTERSAENAVEEDTDE